MLVEVLQVEQSDPEQLLGSCVVDDCVEIAQQNITSFIEMGDVSGTLGPSLIKRIKIYGKKGGLSWVRFSCGGCMLPAASARSVSLNVARFHFSAVFGIVRHRAPP